MTARPATDFPTIPADAVVRVSVRSELARGRFAAAVATGLCVIASIATGIFLTLLVSTFVPPALALLTAALISGFDGAARFAAVGSAKGDTTAGIVIGFALLVLVGTIVAPPLVWWRLRRAGLVGSRSVWPTALEARPIQPNLPEEAQFADVAEEMALAAGLSKPTVGILDRPGENAFVFGTSHEHVALVATPGLLKTLNRSETQGVAAELIATAGNGDLTLAISACALVRTIAVFVVLLRFERAAVRDALRVISGRTTPEETARIEKALDAALFMKGSVGPRWPVLGAIAVLGFVALLSHRLVGPVPALTICFVAIGGLSRLVALGLLRLWALAALAWPLAALWRMRRRLADATAVRLLGDPDAIGSAYRKVDGAGRLAAAEAWSHLAFIPQPTARPMTVGGVIAAFEPGVDARISRLRALGAGAMMTPTSLSAELPPAARVLIVCAGVILVGSALYKTFHVVGIALFLLFFGMAMASIALVQAVALP